MIVVGYNAEPALSGGGNCSWLASSGVIRGMVSNPSSETTFTLFFSVKLFPSLTIFPARKVSSIITFLRIPTKASLARSSAFVHPINIGNEAQKKTRSARPGNAQSFYVCFFFFPITANEQDGVDENDLPARPSLGLNSFPPHVGERAGFV